MKDRIKKLMRDAVSISRAQTARDLETTDDSPVFRIAWNDARNELVAEEGIDFKPRAGVYYRAGSVDSLRRSGNDRAAALRKLGRAVDKAHKAMQDGDTDPHVREAIQRAAEKSAAMLATATGLSRKRTFSAPAKGTRTDNPRSKGGAA